jgi:hypothetical protein
MILSRLIVRSGWNRCFDDVSLSGAVFICHLEHKTRGMTFGHGKAKDLLWAGVLTARLITVR